MNPHPATIVLDAFALLATFATALVVLWAILGAWHWWTYRAFCKREREATKRIQAQLDTMAHADQAESRNRARARV